MSEIKNLKKAVKRVLQAVKNKERIIIFSDADLDGSGSALILEETIQCLAGQVFLVYFPNRETDGYGLSEKALGDFIDKAPGLLLVLDCGVGSFEGVKKAAKAGFDVIIIDHHEILDRLPQPALLIDPKQPGDKYEFKKLAAVSLVYKFSEQVLGKKAPQCLKSSFMEIAALGVIADMMPEEDYNKKVIEQGLASLLQTDRPGMKAIKEIVQKPNDAPRVIFSKMATAINITNIQNHLTESFLLFKESDLAKARIMARRLFEESQKRQIRIQDITEEIVQKQTQKSEAPMIFEGNDLWEQVLTGPVASRICNKFQKPTFIFKIGQEKCRGSVRMPHKMDGVVALKTCSAFLEVYGGHPPAAGFTCSRHQIEGLGKCLEEYFKKNF